jgi:hypothetical protein
MTGDNALTSLSQTVHVLVDLFDVELDAVDAVIVELFAGIAGMCWNRWPIKLLMLGPSDKQVTRWVDDVGGGPVADVPQRDNVAHGR